MKPPTVNPFDPNGTMLLPGLPETGDPPKHRLDSADAARRVWRRILDDDKESSAARAKYDAMFGGEPPYSKSELVETGQGWRSNVDFGEARARLNYTTVSYLDLVNAVPTLVKVQMRPGELDPQDALYFSDVIAEEFTSMYRAWPGAEFAFQNLVHGFVKHGVSVAAFDDPIDWRWRAMGFGDFKLPRMTPTDVDEIEVCGFIRRYQVHQLWAKIENEEAAKKMGWDYKATRLAITKATSGRTDYEEYERVGARLRSNDLSETAQASEVRVVHMFVKEFDGSISQVAFTADPLPETDDKFLYENRGQFKSITECVSIFTFGIGADGTYHSVRGLGHQIFPMMQFANRLRNSIMDTTMVSGSITLQPVDENAVEDFSVVNVGPFNIIPPGFEVRPTNIPNASTNFIPVLNDMTAMADSTTGTFLNQNLVGNVGSREMTRFEFASKQEQLARLSVGALNLFYAPMDRLFRESLKRATRKTYTRRMPGGGAVAEFVERCEARGVPKEAFEFIDHSRTRTVRAIGAGSAAARSQAITALKEYYGLYDEEGRHNLTVDLTSAALGTVDGIERYVPRRSSDLRPHHEKKIAELEGNELSDGVVITVLPNERHMVHLEQHAEDVTELLQAVEQGQMSLEDSFAPLSTFQGHMIEHLEATQANPFVEQEVAQYRQVLQNLDEIVQNAQRRIAKLQRELMEAAQSGEQGSEGQAPEQGNLKLEAEVAAMIQKHKVSMELMREKAQVQQSIMLQKAAINQRIADAKEALNLRRFLPSNYQASSPQQLSP
jgi:hypothetical protein